MRLWSLHPQYLDTRGLVALWREALLAQAVLTGKTTGYTHHPQLDRFRAAGNPVGAICTYLRAVHAEAQARGYAFDRSKIGRNRTTRRLTVSRGQLEHEWSHLDAKLRVRDPSRRARQREIAAPRPHPLFRIVAGDIAEWERGAANGKHRSGVTGRG